MYLEYNTFYVIIEIIAIKEALTNNPVGSQLFQRAISTRTSITKKR